MFEEVHMSLILWRKKKMYITFTSYLTEVKQRASLYSKENFFPTDLQQNRHRYVAQKCEVVGPRIWFVNNFS
jgi:hypothetical protein